jgi:RNA polymerase sigma-70 factor, ECF subfamily
MDQKDWLAEQFEAHRSHLRAVAYRMLGSLSDADDAVQESWLRLSRADSSGIENLRSWLTAVVAHVCLDLLRKRQARREESLEYHVPDPIISSVEGAEPEQEALLPDSVGLALLVVLETLTPAERLSFVLHDMFAVPFDEIAEVIDRSPAAARQLASRARRRVQGASPAYSANRTRQHEVVQAFLAASRNGDFEALFRLLDPDVVLRADAGPRSSQSRVIRGAAAVAAQATAFSRGAKFGRLVLVNGAPGLVAVAGGQLLGVMDLVVTDGRIVEMDILADPERLRDIDISALLT